MKKNWKAIVIIAVVVILFLTVVKDFLIQSAVTSIGSAIVGAPIRMGYLSLGLFTQGIVIKNFKMYNPPGFPNMIMIDMPQIKVRYRLLSLLRGKIHMPLAVINLKEMIVIKDKGGKLNVDSLKIIEKQRQAAEQQKQAKKAPEPKKEAKDMGLRIDELKLNVERVVLRDYSKKPPSVQVFEVALKDKTFKDINGVEQMVTLVMVQAMGPTAIKGAGIYAAATLLSVGFLPAGVAGVLLSKADAMYEFQSNLERVYSAAAELIKKIGELKKEDKAQGLIEGKVDGADIKVKIETGEKGKTKVVVSARQAVLPKAEIAGGVLYQLKEKIK